MEAHMRWVLAAAFGVGGCGLGMVAADRLDSRVGSVCTLGGGVSFALLGAVLGGAGDIVRAIRETASPGRTSGRPTPDA
jgi:hypothetical protein